MIDMDWVVLAQIGLVGTIILIIWLEYRKAKKRAERINPCEYCTYSKRNEKGELVCKISVWVGLAGGECTLGGEKR